MRINHAVVALMLISPLGWAGNMTFQFRNLNFGGNPNNGAFLLNSVQVQNSYKNPGYSADFGIETGVIFLINDGIDRGLWNLQNRGERQNDILVRFRQLSSSPAS
ncbi:hypothetical protein GJV78_10055 [Escherichia alba]|jgi:curli biogenesis system outer membrane secretion channel CsgG|uniref:Curli production assembly/transport component CsgF n=1 Tax=Intestinirhabdus alba TaxID=2899544 RepID=A0A6L6IL15_9ENTR|nr:hypothetical protein [Intestinirhabdus alba]